jgi:hypothetical protein
LVNNKINETGNILTITIVFVTLTERSLPWKN